MNLPQQNRRCQLGWDVTSLYRLLRFHFPLGLRQVSCSPFKLPRGLMNSWIHQWVDSSLASLGGPAVTVLNQKARFLMVDNQLTAKCTLMNFNCCLVGSLFDVLFHNVLWCSLSWCLFFLLKLKTCEDLVRIKNQVVKTILGLWWLLYMLCVILFFFFKIVGANNFDHKFSCDGFWEKGYGKRTSSKTSLFLLIILIIVCMVQNWKI